MVTEIRIKETLLNRKHMKNLDKFFDKINSDIKNIAILSNVDFKVIIVSTEEMREITRKYTFIIPSGMFLVSELTIYLSDKKNMGELLNTYYHELGHLIDYVLGIKSGNNTFYTYKKKITADLEKEVEELDYIYAYNNYQEYFAQAFSECIRNTRKSASLKKTRKMFIELSIL